MELARPEMAEVTSAKPVTTVDAVLVLLLVMGSAEAVATVAVVVTAAVPGAVYVMPNELLTPAAKVAKAG